MLKCLNCGKPMPHNRMRCILTLQAQRDALLAACEELADAYEQNARREAGPGNLLYCTDPELLEARAAIAAAKGEA